MAQATRTLQANPFDRQGATPNAPTISSPQPAPRTASPQTGATPTGANQFQSEGAAKQACVNGACVASCDCQPCANTALECQSSSGKCVDRGCSNITCGVGEACLGGACVASCTGAVCPLGQTCTTGSCVDDTSTDDMGTTDPGTGLDADTTVGGSVATSGCTCHLAPDHRATNAMGLAAGLFVLGAAFFRSRRRVRN